MARPERGALLREAVETTLLLLGPVSPAHHRGAVGRARAPREPLPAAVARRGSGRARARRGGDRGPGGRAGAQPAHRGRSAPRRRRSARLALADDKVRPWLDGRAGRQGGRRARPPRQHRDPGVTRRALVRARSLGLALAVGPAGRLRLQHARQPARPHQDGGGAHLQEPHARAGGGERDHRRRWSTPSPPAAGCGWSPLDGGRLHPRGRGRRATALEAPRLRPERQRARLPAAASR